MGTILSREWGGTNGDPWTTVGFELITTAGTHALIQSAAGWGPSASGTERIYRVTGYPQVTGHTCDLDATWKNAAGAGRWVGVAMRIQADGSCYSVEIDSNVGTTRCRIRRRSSAGTWTTVFAYDSPAGIPASAQLNSGITITGRVENTDEDEVTVSLYYGATLLATYVDTSGSRIESGGTSGVVLDANWTDDDIIVDNLLVRDLEDEWAGSGALDEGVAISVDGTWYSQEDLEAAAIWPRTPRDSIGDPTSVVCTFETRDLYYETNAILYAGAFVKVSVDGIVVACGRLGIPRRMGNTQGAGQTWDLVGPTQLAADVVLAHPDTGENTIRWNLPDDHVEYDPARANKEIGEAIADVLDNHVDGEGGLREQGAAPPDEDDPPYVQSELDLMTAVVAELSGSQDPYAAIEEILSHTKYVLRIDPDALVWHFLDRTDGTVTDVDAADDHIEWEVEARLEDAYTAAEAIGARPETSMETLTDSSGLTAGWASGLEATHDAAKSYKNRDSGSVDTTGTSGGRITMTPAAPFSMDADEWLECRLKFLDGDEADEVYVVYDNSGSTFELDEASWRNGGPAPGDTFEVYGARDLGGRDNGHRELGRRWLLTDLDKGIPEDACALMTIRQNGIEIRTKAEVRTPDDETQYAEILTDVPATGLADYTGGSVPDPCTEGDAHATTAAEVEIQVPTYSRSAPLTPKRRSPLVGYTGSSFARDASKWGGGGRPGRGDPKVRRTYPLPVPGYDGSAAMQAEVDKVLEDILGFLSPIPREVRCVIRGRLDTTWIGLGRLLTISHTGGQATGLESADDLFVYAVEYDVLAKTTTLYAGTQGAGAFRPEKIRKAILDRKLAVLNARSRQSLDDLLACFTTKPQEIGQLAPTQLCGDQVAVTVDGAAKTVSQIAPSSNNLAPQDPSTPAVTCVECSADAPLDVTNALVNATSFQGGGGNAIVKAYDFGTSDYNAAGGENNVQDAVVCLMEHVQELWNSIYITGKVVNDIAKVVNDESVRHCTQMNALRTAILALQACMPYKVDDPTGMSNPCPIVDPGAIIDCDICSDYCAGTIPDAGVCLETPP